MNVDSLAAPSIPPFGKDYVWDETLHLFRRTKVQDFAYSEGQEVEDRLLQIVSKANDRGTFSRELNESISDWPSEYHFSRARHCVVRPLGIQQGDKVLELGCGCGAITRYLGEIGADVVAVEGSLARARVAAERSRDLSNVLVVVDDLLHFETEKRFKWVLLVGVLEYAAMFSGFEDPFEHYLHSVSRFLAPSGRLVVAIENKLGLKYFNGCSEDHVGVPFFGVQDLYGAKTARTFTRRELVEQLSAAGLRHTRFYYPFPDYKLPAVVLSEEALVDPEFDPVDLLLRSTARDYAGSPYRGFDEGLVFAALHNDGLLANLSNSFLVVAQREGSDLAEPQAIAFSFSTGRCAEFCSQTTFVSRPSEISVSKQHLLPGNADRSLVIRNSRITNVAAETPYRQGRQLLWNLLKARARRGNVQAIVRTLQPWMDFLLQEARVATEEINTHSPETRTLASFKLPGNFLDCTPFNLVVTGGILAPIDLEWECDQDISMGWVVTRGVFHSLRAGLAASHTSHSITPVIEKLADNVGLSVLETEIQDWLEAEIEFQTALTGRPCKGWTTQSTSSGMRSFFSEIYNQSQTISAQGEQIAARDGQIGSLHQVLNERSKEIDGLAQDIVSARQALADKEAEIRNLNQAKEVEISNANQALSEVRQHYETVTSGLQQQLSESQTHAELLQRELSDLRERIALIEASTTWRAASVLRRGFARFPRIRRMSRRIIRLAWWTITLQLPRRLRDRHRLFKWRRVIAASDLFNAQWYLEQYPDVAAAGWDPALHYALFAATERRNPSPRFDTGWYLDHNRDVARAGVNPLFHYLQHGIPEGRRSRCVPGFESAAAESSVATTSDYSEWVERYDRVTDRDASAIRKHLATLREKPLISILMPVFNPQPSFLRIAIDSVIAQLYSNWELCIADDASTDPEIRKLLEDYARGDRRIRVVYRSQNGHISAASNSALELVSGDFLALMDHDDALPIHALYMVAVEINEHPDVDVMYSDEDRIDAHGQRYEPHFKPDWNQELFYSYNMINHLGVYRTRLVRQLGGFREGFEGSQDYDLVLRLLSCTKPDRIRHIPHILYHWRLGGGVQTFSTERLSEAVKSARRALAEYFASRDENVQITDANPPCFNRVRRFLPDPAPRVSLIVLTRDKLSLLRNCVEGLLHKTRYPNVEIIIVDNESCEPATLEYLQSLRAEDRVRILRIQGAFNHSAFNNMAAAQAEGEIIGFINNDLEVIEPDWLEEMVSQAVQPGVGAVGAKLYYPEDTIQHGGVVLGVAGTAGHSHRHFRRNDAGYFYRLQVLQNASCVTAACMIISKKVFAEVGGFDEVNLKTSYNDVDLCLRIRQAGYSIVWTPYAELYHLEGASRGRDDEPKNAKQASRDIAYLQQRWGPELASDPFYNPNLTLVDESFDLAFPPRAVKPWRPLLEGESRQMESLAQPTSSATETSRLGGARKATWNGQYVPRSSESLDSRSLSLKAIAFYLPQFHPIPENDMWWGKNFTEWQNVTTAVPQFVGHYQPHLPGDLGFYDLRVPEVMAEQTEIAKQYGISAFCFHYYWFGGTRLLERPLEQFLANRLLDIEFCICWANENWTRRWDGLDSEILIAQQYSAEDDFAFIKSLLPAFRDPRYIQVHGKPLLLVYRIDLLPDPVNTVIRWREAVKAYGIPGLYVTAVLPFDSTELGQYGVDAGVEFPPHQTFPVDITKSQALINKSFSGGAIYDYAEIAGRCGRRTYKDNRILKGVMPAWDNTARRGAQATVFHGSTPSIYAAWLKDACDVTMQNPVGERLLFINAWNEWAEGAHLEPDARYGYAYLDSTANILRSYYRDDAAEKLIADNNSRFTKKSEIAVVLHCYHEELLNEIVGRYLGEYSDAVDVFATVRPDASLGCLEYLQQSLGNVLFLPEANRGRDMRPFLLALRRLRELGYTLACKLHTKRSPQLERGDHWRDSMISSLLGGGDAITLAEQRFANRADLGLLVPPGSLIDLGIEEINAGNRVWLDRLLPRMGCADLIGSYRVLFPAGSMYWFRVEALAGLDDLGLAEDAFELEAGQLDGTLAHAIERLILLYASTKGYGVEEFEATRMAVGSMR